MDYISLMENLQKREISPVYLFYGEETFLLNEALQSFKNLIPAEVRDFNMDIVDGQEVSVETIVGLASTLPFMSETRLVIVQETNLFKSKSKKKQEDEKDTDSEKNENSNSDDSILLEYFENPSPNTCLIFTSGSVDRKKKIYKNLAKTGQVVEFKPLKGIDLNRWIEKKARDLGSKIEAGAIAKLVTAAGNDLRQLDNELKKISTYVGPERKITSLDVDMLVSKTVENSIFEVVDAVGDKKYIKAIQIIKEMISYGESPMRILFMISRQFRLILQAKVLAEEGYAEKDIASKLGLHPYVAQKCARQGKNFSVDELEKALEKMLKIDGAMKRGQQEPLLALELMLVNLCS